MRPNEVKLLMTHAKGKKERVNASESLYLFLENTLFNPGARGEEVFEYVLMLWTKVLVPWGRQIVLRAIESSPCFWTTKMRQCLRPK